MSKNAVGVLHIQPVDPQKAASLTAITDAFVVVRAASGNIYRHSLKKDMHAAYGVAGLPIPTDALDAYILKLDPIYLPNTRHIWEGARLDNARESTVDRFVRHYMEGDKQSYEAHHLIAVFKQVPAGYDNLHNLHCELLVTAIVLD